MTEVIMDTSRMTLAEIGRESGVSDPTVLRIARIVGAYGAGYIRSSVGALMTPALRARVLTHVTARALAEDPQTVLAGAEALAELARRVIADRDQV
jgi:DNA-binding MurR/RpiR family transcriptional regulator